jgi:hypothetical protein
MPARGISAGIDSAASNSETDMESWVRSVCPWRKSYSFWCSDSCSRCSATHQGLCSTSRLRKIAPLTRNWDPDALPRQFPTGEIVRRRRCDRGPTRPDSVTVRGGVELRREGDRVPNPLACRGIHRSFGGQFPERLAQRRRVGDLRTKSMWNCNLPSVAHRCCQLRAAHARYTSRGGAPLDRTPPRIPWTVGHTAAQ